MSAEQQASSAPTLTRQGEVFLLDLGDGENRFNERFVEAIEGHLDEVCAAQAPRALVTTASGKIWSNGLDLEWLAEHPQQIQGFARRVQLLLARFLEPFVPSVAALQGHHLCCGRDARARTRPARHARGPRLLLPAGGRHQHLCRVGA